jgi:hypothetical protein
MDTHCFIVEPSEVPEKTVPLDTGGETQIQMYLKGTDGGPEAIRARFSEGCEVEPHFHLTSQFQVLLKGKMDFPTFRLDAPAVHYTEHNVPYGPFITSHNQDMLVLHTKPGSVIRMRDTERRHQANTRGREITRCAQEVEWEPLPDYPGARRKVLIPASEGPSAELIECPPDMQFSLEAPAYGRYEVVLSGSVLIDTTQLGPNGLRFVEAGEQAPPLTCGPHGASLMVLSFDQDTAQSSSGSMEDVIDRMEQ